MVDLSGGRPRLLRPGGVTLPMLEEVAGPVEVDAAVTGRLREGERAASPGMKYKHYAPKCRVILLDGGRQAYAGYINSHQTEGEYALCYEEDLPLLRCPAISIGKQADEAAQAARLFDSLRRLDDEGAQVVYARCPGKTGVGLALYNRLIRAAAFEVIHLDSAPSTGEG